MTPPPTTPAAASTCGSCPPKCQDHESGRWLQKTFPTFWACARQSALAFFNRGRGVSHPRCAVSPEPSNPTLKQASVPGRAAKIGIISEHRRLQRCAAASAAAPIPARSSALDLSGPGAQCRVMFLCLANRRPRRALAQCTPVCGFGRRPQPAPRLSQKKI